jgi:hypothetical protein
MNATQEARIKAALARHEVTVYRNNRPAYQRTLPVKKHRDVVKELAWAILLINAAFLVWLAVMWVTASPDGFWL